MTMTEYLRHNRMVGDIADRVARCNYTHMGTTPNYAPRAASVLREIARLCVSEAWRLEHEEEPV